MSDPSVPWLVAGYGIAAVLLVAYVLRLSRALRDVDRRRRELKGSDQR